MIPPHSEESEKFVLGSMMLDKEAVEKAVEIIAVDDFYFESHQTIFQVITSLYGANNPCDVPSVSGELERTNKDLKNLLSGMVESVSTAMHVDYHAEIVKDYAILRNMIHRCSEIVADCFRHEENPREILEKAEKYIYSISDNSVKGRLRKVGEGVFELTEVLEKAGREKKMVTGIETGIPKLDLLTGGFQPGNLVIIAARPGVGKTALALGIGIHNSFKGVPVAFYSLEMSHQEINMRILAWKSGINLYNLKTGAYKPGEWTDIHAVLGKIYEAPLYIDASSFNMTPMTIRSASRRLAGKMLREKKPLGLVVVDYLQLLTSGKKTDSRQYEVAEISRSLKALAMDLNVPVLALSQLNRSPEETGRNGKPRLSDLRDSGGIEQDADLVMFLWRESMYKEVKEEEKNHTKLMIAKHRNGTTGEIDLYFQREITKFVEMEKVSN
jgi:replicative DNA helicase